MARVESVLHGQAERTTAVHIPANAVVLDGDLTLPRDATGLVLFAHGSGSSRFSPRNRFVAEVFQRSGCATLLFDLLTRGEEAEDAAFGHLRFNIRMLTGRLALATQWAARNASIRQLPIGYFGSSTGAAAALEAAAALGELVSAVVSRGGRPDLASEALPHVTAATLLIVGENDDLVLRLNSRVYKELRCEKDFAIVAGATHLFEEPGALNEVARLSARWFQTHFKAAAA